MSMPTSMHGVSLFETALPKPDTKEGKSFFADLKLPKNGKPGLFHAHYRCNLVLAMLILEICQETADSIESKNYKNFDALIRNFGCQITALQNHRLFKNASLREEAKRVNALAQERMAAVAAYWAKPPLGACGMDVVDYLKQSDFDIQLSSEMAQLVRFRLLNLVNTNVFSRGKELPCTKVDEIMSRAGKIVTSFNLKHHKIHYEMTKTKGFYDKWIAGLQAEEAKTAVSFIQSIGDELVQTGAHPRAMLIDKMLSDKYARESKPFKSSNSPIVSLPQLYTGEAALRGVDGIVLIKNKLTFCGENISGVKPVKVFVKMPEGRVMSPEEIKAVSDDEPVVVLEGYIPSGMALASRVEEIGVVALLNATLARLPQYASGTEKEEFSETFFDDPEAGQDLKKFSAMDDVYRLITVDHMYCGSLMMEGCDRLTEEVWTDIPGQLFDFQEQS
jgi:hypothetical protein